MTKSVGNQNYCLISTRLCVSFFMFGGGGPHDRNSELWQKSTRCLLCNVSWVSNHFNPPVTSLFLSYHRKKEISRIWTQLRFDEYLDFKAKFLTRKVALGKSVKKFEYSILNP